MSQTYQRKTRFEEIQSHTNLPDVLIAIVVLEYSEPVIPLNSITLRSAYNHLIRKEVDGIDALQFYVNHHLQSKCTPLMLAALMKSPWGLAQLCKNLSCLQPNMFCQQAPAHVKGNWISFLDYSPKSQFNIYDRVSALHLAVLSGDQAGKALILIQNRADPYLKAFPSGLTPIQLASSCGFDLLALIKEHSLQLPPPNAMPAPVAFSPPTSWAT